MRLTMTAVALLASGVLSLPSHAVAQDIESDLWLISANRESALLLDLAHRPLGMSGALVQLVQVNGSGTGRSEIVILSFEMDCGANRLRTVMTHGADRYGNDPTEEVTVSEWSSAPPNSNLAYALAAACDDGFEPPSSWTDIDDNLGLFIRAYYEGFLGETY